MRKKNEETPTKIQLETFSISNCQNCHVQIGQFTGNEFNVNNKRLLKIDVSGDSSVENATSWRFKSLPMSSWSRDQVRCWIMNITLPKYVASQFYQEHVNGSMLKMYNKRILKKDFRLYTSNARFISKMITKWLKKEKDVRKIKFLPGSENSSVPSSITCDMDKAKKNIKDIILHLKSNLRSFRDSFTELDISDLNYFHRSDLIVTSNSLDSFFIEIVNTGKSNFIVGVINVIPDKTTENFIDNFRKTLRKIKDTGLVSFIIGDFYLNSSSRKLLLYEKNIISALTDNLFFRLRTESALVRNSFSFHEVITNDTGVFSSDDGS